MVLIEASILSADFARLGEQAVEAEAAGVDAVQVDVMDGRFVPDITFGPGVVRALRNLVKIKIDVDLMIVKPEQQLATFADAGADRLIVHLEACTHPYRILESIRNLGVEVGIAIAPGTSLGGLEELLNLADMIQVMTVNPGWGGQLFLQDQLDKVRRLRRLLDDAKCNVSIGVDGGVSPKTAPLAVSAGATILVSGSSIYNEKASVADNVAALRASIDRKERKGDGEQEV